MLSLATVFASVTLYISVGFLEQSALPAFLAHVYLVKHPNATKDDMSHAVTTHMAACSLCLGAFALTVAGWAGRLSDRFGRRTMAFIPAMGQAAGMALLSLAAYYEVSWHYVVAAWAAQGIFGGPFVFLAAAFAYIADHKRSGEMRANRGRAFAALDGLLLFVASFGPLVGAALVGICSAGARLSPTSGSSHPCHPPPCLLADPEIGGSGSRTAAKVGFGGAFAACSGVYVCAACTFLLARPSPQQFAPPSSTCSSWASSSTPALLWRMLRTERLNVLGVAFVLAVGGITGGAISIVFYGQRYLSWGQQQIGLLIAGFSLFGACAITFVHPLLSCIFGRRISDLTMVRCAYVGPVLYFPLFVLLPRKDICAYALLPLLASGMSALPHFRALMSLARPDNAQGELLSLVAALESTPSLYASAGAAILFNVFLHQPWIVLVGWGSGLPLVAMLLLWFGVSDVPVGRATSSDDVDSSGGDGAHCDRLGSGLLDGQPHVVDVVGHHQPRGTDDEGRARLAVINQSVGGA